MTGRATACRRGRPVIIHDNQRVQAFLGRFASLSDLREDVPALDDVLTGVAHLQTEGQCSTRPLSRRMLLQVLQECDRISTEAVTVALRRAYSRTAVARYTAHARVASKAIDQLLMQRPEWEAAAGTLMAARDSLDGPFLRA